MEFSEFCFVVIVRRSVNLYSLKVNYYFHCGHIRKNIISPGQILRINHTADQITQDICSVLTKIRKNTKQTFSLNYLLHVLSKVGYVLGETIALQMTVHFETADCLWCVHVSV